MNTTDILTAASDRYNGVLDISELSSAADGGRIARVYESVYHSDRGTDLDSDDEDALWLDLGEEKDSDWESALQLQLRAARDNSISTHGYRELDSVLLDFKDFILLRLNSREPSHVTPLKLHIRPGFMPIRTRQRKYSPEKRKFMEQYVDNLLRLGFVKHTQAPEWVSAPHIVPKKTPQCSVRLSITGVSTLLLSLSSGPCQTSTMSLAMSKVHHTFSE